jgi:hypothetical protein
MFAAQMTYTFKDDSISNPLFLLWIILFALFVDLQDLWMLERARIYVDTIIFWKPGIDKFHIFYQILIVENRRQYNEMIFFVKPKKKM